MSLKSKLAAASSLSSEPASPLKKWLSTITRSGPIQLRQPAVEGDALFLSKMTSQCRTTLLLTGSGTLLEKLLACLQTGHLLSQLLLLSSLPQLLNPSQLLLISSPIVTLSTTSTPSNPTS
jgi:hypothetical protein